jgi:hypothetical protein
MIKETVHKRIYGQDKSQLNELTKFLIDHGSRGKREPIKNFATVCADKQPDNTGVIQTKLKQVNSQEAV